MVCQSGVEWKEPAELLTDVSASMELGNIVSSESNDKKIRSATIRASLANKIAER